MAKICILGCKSTTIFLIEALEGIAEISCVITISPETAKKNQVADYVDLKKYCEGKQLKSYVVDRYDLKSEMDINTFQNMKMDIGFVIGWQRLIPEQVLKVFSVGVFGMHGSTDNLPIGRGRSPMNWALIEQRKHFFTNIFKYDSGVDSGDILDSFVFSIQPNDTSETMHFKNALAMKVLILRNLENLISGKLLLRNQKDETPTFYPKRTPADSLIDWREDIYKLDAFIRAVTKPFNGAFSFIFDEKITIWRASIFETELIDFGYDDLKFGIIVETFPNGKFLIKCRGGLLIVHEYSISTHIEKGMVLNSPTENIKQFKLNRYGYHDLRKT